MNASSKLSKARLTRTAEITAAYVSNNHVPRENLAALIDVVFNSLCSAGTAAPGMRQDDVLTPAVPIKQSITPDFLICLEDGKRFKLLKRYLMSRYGLTPDAYRTKWNLPTDYPMVAANYAARRSQLAKSFGLGRKPQRVNPAGKKRRSVRS